MKHPSRIILLVLLLLTGCTSRQSPVIGLTMAYWDGKYSINKSYVDAIRDNGGEVRIIPCSDNADLLRRQLKELDGIVFIGGRDYIPEWYGKTLHPSMTVMDTHRASFDSLFIHLALESGKPILGICAGEQLLNIASGGKLFQDIPDHRGVQHSIYITPSTRLAALYGDSMMVNSWHHQCVDPDHLHPDYIISAWSADSIVEAIEYSGKQWIMGTQFHPERFPIDQRDKLFTLFIQETQK